MKPLASLAVGISVSGTQHNVLNQRALSFCFPASCRSHAGFVVIKPSIEFICRCRVLPSVFEIFERHDDSSVRAANLGIIFSIVRNIVHG